ncbi:MAG: DUF3794 domain-containing protein [Firmicutes bacterium]|nr:DUF3794 domain-containing protein [Bacillota bacterium]
MLTTRLLKLECVVGENTGEASVESRILLAERAKKIADIHARLLDLSADVVDCQVMVQGCLHKQIFYVGEDDRVHHQAEDVPFAVFIDVPGAAPGMGALVQGRIAKLTHNLIDMQELSQRAILQFFVKVVEDCQLNVVLDPNGPLCKAECVVGETTQICPVENVVDLERPAIKVRDVRVMLEDVAAEVADDQVIFQGTLVKSIFFIATNNEEFFQEERVPFTGVAVIPGARPGQNVTLRPQILRVDKFLTNGNQVRQRVVVAVFVKVTETCELNVAEDTTGPLVLCKRVVAAGTKQVLQESVADLSLPAQKVHEIQARVTDLNCEVIDNKVIVQGVVHKQIFFVGADDIVHHQAEDVPFTTFIEVPGARPMMSCQLKAEVEHISWHLLDPVESDPGLRMADPYLEDDDRMTFARLMQRTVIQVTAAVAEDHQICVKCLPLPTDQPFAQFG